MLSNEYNEICVDIEWGKARGKRYGSGPTKVLALHGYQENCNSFTRIIPYLDGAGLTVFAMDLLGNGLSDHCSKGFIYDMEMQVIMVKKIVQALNLSNFIFLAHSMSAMVAITYTSIFPKDVKALISIDVIIPLYLRPKRCVEDFRSYFHEYLKADGKRRESRPSYEIDSLVKSMIETAESMDESSALLLLERGAELVEGTENTVTLLKDPRVTASFKYYLDKFLYLEIAKSITCPTLIIKATNGYNYAPMYYEEILPYYKEGSELFRMEEIEGDHHVHLTNPGPTAEVINNFIKDVLLIKKNKL